MNVNSFFKNCLSFFQDILSYEKKYAKIGVLGTAKILSCFAGIILLGCATALYGRVRKKEEPLFSYEKDVDDLAKTKLNNIGRKSEEISPSKIIQTVDSKTVRSYGEDLTSSEKSEMRTNYIDENTLQIVFKEFPGLNFTIRQQEIFDSQAQVIVNAANTQLFGGGGIDGAIHDNGGQRYKEAHDELQKLYNSRYVSGHAALIDSGSLKENYQIDHVIVVAGPQGEATSDKENALYSCYYNSLLLAEHQGKTSIAFPSISTGLFRFPQDRAACISLKAIYNFIKKHPNTKLTAVSIHFVVKKSKSNLEIYKKSCD